MLPARFIFVSFPEFPPPFNVAACFFIDMLQKLVQKHADKASL